MKVNVANSKRNLQLTDQILPENILNGSGIDIISRKLSDLKNESLEVKVKTLKLYLLY